LRGCFATEKGKGKICARIGERETKNRGRKNSGRHGWEGAGLKGKWKKESHASQFCQLESSGHVNYHMHIRNLLAKGCDYLMHRLFRKYIT